MKNQARALATECNLLIQEFETNLEIVNTGYKTDKKRRIKEINSVNLMVVKDQYSDSIFRSQAFLSTAKDKATFILDTRCKGAHICKVPALLVTRQEKLMTVMYWHVICPLVCTEPVNRAKENCKRICNADWNLHASLHRD
jgi:hypothetical protein